MHELEISDRVARVTLDHPPVNAIGDAWLRDFNGRLDDLAAREDWHVLHIRSALRVFCAGADLAEMRERFEADDGVQAMVACAAAMQALFARIEALPQVTLCEIGGAALGGGFELALACDLRIVSEAAKVGLPEARLGLVPGAGGTQRLTRLAGRAIASRLILSAEVVDGRRAVELGLAQWSAPADELRQRAADLAAAIGKLAPRALAECKACVRAAAGPAHEGFDRELEASRRLYADAHTRELVAAFLARSAKP